jgi:hypothetical protein
MSGGQKKATTKKKNSPAPRRYEVMLAKLGRCLLYTAFRTLSHTSDIAPKLSKPTAFLLKHHQLHHRHVSSYDMVKNDDDVVPYLPHSSSRTLFINKQHKKTPLSNCNVLNNEYKVSCT